MAYVALVARHAPRRGQGPQCARIPPVAASVRRRPVLILRAGFVGDEVGEAAIGLLHVGDKSQPVAREPQSGSGAGILVNAQGQDSGACRIVDTGDALVPAVLCRDERERWLAPRLDRAGIDVDVRDTLSLVHEGPREALEVPQDVRARRRALLLV